MYINENKLIADLWKIKKLQNMFDSSDIFTYTEELIIKTFAEKYNIKNENSQFIMLLDGLYLHDPDNIPTVAELLEICNENGILEEVINNG